MARRFWVRMTLCAAFLCVGSGVPAQQFGDAEKFKLRGRVVNKVTGEPVGGALVELLASGRRAQFSAANGTFEFGELLRGSYILFARKPGYFNDRDLGLQAGGTDTTHAVPADEDAVLKLTPEGVIFGRVEDERGRPLEGIQVQAEGWTVTDGKRQLRPGFGLQTDDEGNYRIAGLTPGDYYLKFSEPGGNRTMLRDAPVRARARKPDPASERNQGYGTQYYPGVADVAAASAIHVQPGVPVPIQQSLERLRLYEVSGVVRDGPTNNSFSVTLMAAGGDLLGRPEISPNTGEFRIPGVPPGRYLLRVNAQDPTTDRLNRRQSQLVAQAVIDVSGDISGLTLVLGHGATIGVQVRDEGRRTDEGQPQVAVRLQSTEFQSHLVEEQLMTPPQDPRAPRSFENVAGGSYSVEAFTFGQGYVASLRCAGTDLLKEELKVGAGTSMAPIEVRVRHDGAQLTVSAVENGKPVTGRVVLYSEEYPKRSISLVSWPNGTTGAGMLAPDTYKLIATRGLAELEFKNPAAMAKYLAHATSVTLAPDTNVNVQVEVQDVESEP